MRSSVRFAELTGWAVAALAAGCVIAVLDMSASEVQGTVLLLMLVAFALTLPGRAPVALVAVACGVSLPLTYLVAAPHRWNPGLFIALIPAGIGAAGGRFAGKLLEATTASLGTSATAEGPWYRRPLSSRVLLAAVLTALALIGVAPVAAVLTRQGHPAATWLALVWQIAGYLGWIVITPLVFKARTMVRGAEPHAAVLPTFAQWATHLALATMIAVAQAALSVVLTTVLLVPLVPSAGALFLAALSVYFATDVLTYVAVLTVGFLSDADRLAREAAMRRAALEREVLDARLTALRARLNPHFLFNVLNSAVVLSRSGRSEQTSEVLEGLTALLRYVLDEQRTHVPLHDELAFAEGYLELQRVRLGARLRWKIDADPTVESVTVPTLILQPAVENAVEHGVSAALEGGSVTIVARRAGSWLELVVEDDGPAPATVTPTGAGIGLASIRERLLRLYGAGASVVLERREGGGAITRIRIPITAE